ncbi:MAG TPA: ABC transporter permease [Gemmatimonadaceae bacterium]|jgi:predicted permease
MDTLLRDIRYSARKLLRTPSFTVIAVATLALAIGSTTAVFSIVNGVLLKPLPFRDPESVVIVGSSSAQNKMEHLSAPDFLDYRDQTHSFVGMAQVQDRQSFNLTATGADPVRLNAAQVGATFFDLLGVTMQRGRGFLLGDDEHGAKHVVVLSDRLWRSNFGGDLNIVGRSVSLNGNPYDVVGVAPASLTYPSTPDVWLPFELESWMTDPSNRGAHFIFAVARLRPGVTIDAAQRDMATVGARLTAEYPKSNAKFGGAVENLRTWLTGDVRAALFTMFGAVLFVLVIACANVANLLLVRSAGRETELAVRTALGAGRTRIIRQLVTESVLLALAGAAIGGALAAWAVDAIVAFGPQALPRLADIVVDTRVLAFSVAIAIVTGIAFGLFPALSATNTELGQMLREGTRGGKGRKTAQRTRGLLVMTEMALAVVLLVGAGLLIRSFVNLVHVNPGFQPDHVISFDVTTPEQKYPHDREIRQFAEQVRDGISSTPGAVSVATSFTRPLDGRGMKASFDVDGRSPAAPGHEMLADVRPVSANFFSTMGIHLVRGRGFTTAEEQFGPPPVVVVTQAFAKKYFPTEDPIGKHIKVGIGHDSAGPNSNVDMQGEIVGIVNDVHNTSLGQDPTTSVYVGWGTLPMNDISFLVRYRGDIQTMSSAIREQVHAVDSDLPIYTMKTMSDAVSESVAQPRFYTVLLTAFAGLALLLAALGIYGVISYAVTQRTRELGIRIALGATEHRVVRSVLGQGLALSVGGTVVGLIGAYWLVHLLAALLYGVGETDATTFAVVATLLVGVAALASYVPARRAARVDPVIAMRAE